MPQRPQNHVTRSRDASMREAGQAWPDIPLRLLEHLEHTYPPRCRDRGEDEWSHERYAGMVDLVQTMRAVYEQSSDFSTDDAEAVEEQTGRAEGGEETFSVEL